MNSSRYDIKASNLRSIHRLPTAHAQHLPGDERAGRAHEERDGAGDIVRLPEAPKRDLAQHGGRQAIGEEMAEAWIGLQLLLDLAVEGRVGRAWADHVDRGP